MYKLKDIVRFHRKQAGLSRRELSDLSGVSTTFLSDLEGGKETLQYNKVLDVLKTLNISLVFESPIMNELNDEKS
jgi:HTH-type transcriptional regulator / antitoxin HipB